MSNPPRIDGRWMVDGCIMRPSSADNQVDHEGGGLYLDNVASSVLLLGSEGEGRGCKEEIGSKQDKIITSSHIWQNRALMAGGTIMARQSGLKIIASDNTCISQGPGDKQSVESTIQVVGGASNSEPLHADFTYAWIGEAVTLNAQDTSLVVKVRVVRGLAPNRRTLGLFVAGYKRTRQAIFNLALPCDQTACRWELVNILSLQSSSRHCRAQMQIYAQLKLSYLAPL